MIGHYFVSLCWVCVIRENLRHFSAGQMATYGDEYVIALLGVLNKMFYCSVKSAQCTCAKIHLIFVVPGSIEIICEGQIACVFLKLILGTHHWSLKILSS